MGRGHEAGDSRDGLCRPQPGGKRFPLVGVSPVVPTSVRRKETRYVRCFVATGFCSASAMGTIGRTNTGEKCRYGVICRYKGLVYETQRKRKQLRIESLLFRKKLSGDN